MWCHSTWHRSDITGRASCMQVVSASACCFMHNVRNVHKWDWHSLTFNCHKQCHPKLQTFAWPRNNNGLSSWFLVICHLCEHCRRDHQNHNLALAFFLFFPLANAEQNESFKIRCYVSSPFLESPDLWIQNDGVNLGHPSFEFRCQ